MAKGGDKVLMAAVATAVKSSGSFAVVVGEPGTRENPLVPLDVAAQRMACSVKTVRRLIYRGVFPGAQRGASGRLCVPELEVLSYLRGLRGEK